MDVELVILGFLSGFKADLASAVFTSDRGAMDGQDGMLPQ